MTLTVKGTAKLADSSKYLKQLCKHFAHKVDVELGDEQGVVTFPMGPCTITAEDGALTFYGETDHPEGIAAFKEVITSHLDRFAWREAPVEYFWEETAP